MTGKVARVTPRFAIIIADRDSEEFFFSRAYHAAAFDHEGTDFDCLKPGLRVEFELGRVEASGMRRLARHVRPLYASSSR